jgi:hypothetical protein
VLRDQAMGHIASAVLADEWREAVQTERVPAGGVSCGGLCKSMLSLLPLKLFSLSVADPFVFPSSHASLSHVRRLRCGTRARLLHCGHA